MTLKERTRIFWDSVAAKEMPGIESAYVPKEDTYVILEGPRYTTTGYSNIIKGWGDFCNSPIDMISCDWCEGPQEEIEGSMGWIGGMIDMSITVNGKRIDVRFRASFVYRMYEGDWKIRHEHVSAPLEDPYGIGDWLVKD